MSALVTLAETKEHLGIPATDTSEDARLTSMILGASGIAEDYCDRIFSLTPYDERHDGGRHVLTLDTRPLASLTSIEDMDTTPPTSVAASSVSIESAPAQVYQADGSNWGCGRRRWRVRYVAGFAAAPEGVKAAIKALVGFLRTDPSGSMKSESMGDYSYTLAAGADGEGLPPVARALLKPWRLPRV